MFHDERRRSFSIGRAAETTVFVIVRNLPVLLLLAMLLAGLSLGGTVWLTSLAERRPELALAVLPAQMLGSLVSGYLLQAFVVHAAAADLAGRDLDFAQMFRATGATLGVVLVLSLLLSLAVFAGLALLILPGLLAAAVWAVAVPVAVIDRVGVFGALSRSQVLTRRHRLGVLGVLGAFALVGFALTWIFARVGVTLGVITGQALVWFGVRMIGQAAASLLAASAAAAIYFELRQVKDGVASDAIGRVFT